MNAVTVLINRAMAKSADEEVRELKEKNSTLVQKVQYFKMLAAQKEEEKMELMKELNQLRLTFSHYRSASSALDSVLDSSIQEFGEQSLTRLVEVSSSITRTVEVMKSYLHKKQEIEVASPHTNSIQDSPRDRSSNKVLRVVPMIRGRSIGKPIILLRPIDPAAYGLRQSDSDSQQEAASPPQHALQDVYIPLHRIDTETLNSLNVHRGSQPVDTLENDDSIDDNELHLEGEDVLSENAERETNEETYEDSQQDEMNNKREMETVLEESEDENWSPQVRLSRELPVNRRRADNPMEGPSWLLDRLCTEASSPVIGNKSAKQQTSQQKKNNSASLEPDSTTDVSQTNVTLGNASPVRASSPAQVASPETPAPTFTPTRRRRRRSSLTSSPRLSLALLDGWGQVDREQSQRHRENLNGYQDPTKVLVMVAKMRTDDLWNRVRSHSTPPSRSRIPLDAPSPNGSTQDAGPIVMDCPEEMQLLAEQNESMRSDRIDNRRESQTVNCRTRNKSNDTSDKLMHIYQEKTDDSDKKSNAQKRSKISARDTGSLTRETEREDASSKRETACEAGTSEELSSRAGSSDDSECETGREHRRPKRPRRAPQSYKEKPLNRKLRQ